MNDREKITNHSMTDSDSSPSNIDHQKYLEVKYRDAIDDQGRFFREKKIHMLDNISAVGIMFAT